jgi:hypothetical protein
VNISQVLCCSILALASFLLFEYKAAGAATVSALFARGYTVIPDPQNVELKGRDFEFGSGWGVALGQGVKAGDVTVESLTEGLENRFGVLLEAGGRGKTIELSIHPGSVEIGEATDGNKAALAEQAYKLELGSNRIRITANAPTGLFYGVQTLEQLVKPAREKLWLPEGEITDWPDLEQRDILWEDLFHVEHLDVLKAALRQAAFYKINGFVIKLDGHFEYHSAPALVDPYALSPEQLQDLTNYGLRYHVQLIPYLDGPAHIPWILKHPEYASLREFPDSNYEICTANPDSYKLLFGMYQDLLDATKGAKYFHFGGDEPYFVGMAKNSQCDEATRAQELGSTSKVLVEFYAKAAGYLHDRGRTPMFWGYEPLVPEDIASLPTYLINGLTFGPKYDPVFKAHRIRQMIAPSNVTWTEFFFPDYYIRPSTESVSGPAGEPYGPAQPGPGRVAEMYDLISSPPARKDADLMGTYVTGWDTTGLHLETMWLGYITGSAPGWHPGGGNPRELMASFYKLFYGPGTVNMGRLYQRMSEQAQFWKESWDVAASSARKGIWGDYPETIYKTRQPALDQTLSLPPVPSGGLLKRNAGWKTANTKRLQIASLFLSQNDELMDLLHENLQLAHFNRYNLEVYLSTAWLYRQNLEMLIDLAQIDALLNSAQESAAKADAVQALTDIDQALDLAEKIRAERNTVLNNAVVTWYESWFPRVEEANGRRYLQQVDDVKDYVPYRTVDMTYLVYRELILPFGDWAEKVRAARNQYAQAHNLPTRDQTFDWQDTRVTTLQ